MHNRSCQIRSDKFKSNEKIKLVENKKIINENKDNAELLNSFFANVVKNVKIPKFSDSTSLAEKVPYPIFTVILKYKNHPSLIVIKNVRNTLDFCFCG